MNFQIKLKNTVLLALIMFVCSSVCHELFVIHPHSLARKFDFNRNTYKGLVESSVAGFGTFQNNVVFQGRVQYPLNNTDGCNPFTELDFNTTHLKEASLDGHKNIIMVDRGNCHFVKKVQNVQ